MKRTLAIQATQQIGEKILLQGWVQTVRSHGKIAFLDLRDRTGFVQVVGDKELGKLSIEDVVEIEGVVKQRPDHLINPKMPTGTIEIEVQSFKVLNHSQELPLPIDSDGQEIEESVRLKYRYLDLRRPRLQRNLKLRSKLVQSVREYLFDREFTEIETPLLTKSTPEGSRDFLVPSRLQPGKFYALPQSPQQYKQLLMTAGFEQYFQIARAVRDEDLRADRGFEHTQIDLEMSFVSQRDVMELVEKMVTTVIKKVGGTIANEPFPVFTYQQALDKFGADKFDMRTQEQKDQNQLAFAWVIDFPFFEKTEDGNWTYTHNPFSHPHQEHVDDVLNKTNIQGIKTMQYDLVCNGFEVGGGSIRAHDPQILKKVFEIIGHTPEKIEEQFGHMLRAFSLGTPPHGGIALGVERLVMILAGEKYLREVQAFPQTTSGSTSVMSAPSQVDNKQLAEIGLALEDQSGSSDLSPYQKLKQFLEHRQVKYKEFSHEAVHTSEEAAAVRGTDLRQGAKALVMVGDKKPLLLVVSAATKVDFKALKKSQGIKDLRMSSPQEALEITKIKIGAIHPFGNLYNIPTFIDRKLSENKVVYFNAGDHTKSFEIDYQDLLRHSQAVEDDFTRA